MMKTKNMTLFDLSTLKTSNRPLYIINITEGRYLDYCVEHIVDELKEFWYPEDLEDFKKATKQFLEQYDCTKYYSGEVYYNYVKKFLDCKYLEDYDDEEDDEDDILLTDIINNLKFIIHDYYKVILEHWNNNLIDFPDQDKYYIIKDNQYWQIGWVNSRIKTVGIRNKKHYKEIFWEEPYDLILQKEYYRKQFFTKKFFTTLKNSFSEAKKTFEKTFRKILMQI